MKRLLLVAGLFFAGCHDCVDVLTQANSCPPCQHPNNRDPSGPDENGCYMVSCGCNDYLYADMAVRLDMSPSRD
jgi:hypothetical protein